MVDINMPGGAIEPFDPASLLWMRPAFDEEWRGATMIRHGEGIMYSIESIPALVAKLSAGGARLATFRAPDRAINVIVNAARVRRVDANTSSDYSQNAKSILRFSASLRLAVRETPEEARAKLAASPTAAATGRVALATSSRRISAPAAKKPSKRTPTKRRSR